MLLGFIISRINFGEFCANIKDMDKLLVFLSFMLSLIMTGLITVRWKYLLRIVSIHLNFSALLRIVFIGICFSNVIPTSIGGDVYRIYCVSKETGKRPEAFLSVFLDRFIGVYTLFLLSLFAMVFCLHIILEQYQLLYPQLIIILSFFGMSAFANRRMLSFVKTLVIQVRDRFSEVVLISKLFDKIENVYSTLKYYRYRKSDVLKIVGISLLARLIWVIVAYLLALSINVSLSPLSFFLIIPIVETIRMIPITLGGIGIREGAMIYFLALFGVPGTAAAMISFFFYGFVMLQGVIGGVLYTYGHFIGHDAVKEHQIIYGIKK